MKFCRYCGGEVSDTAKACGHCGRWLAVEPTSPPPGEVPADAERTEPQPVVPSEERISSEPGALAPVPPPSPPEPEQVVRAPGATDEGVLGPPALSGAAASSPEPKRHIPAWAWGLGAVVIVLVVGTALVVNGAVGLPGQQTTKPKATLVATSWATRAPAYLPTPMVESVTVLLGREDATKTVQAGQPVVVEWVWGVCDPTLLEQNIAALDFTVTIDGRVTATDDMARYRTEVREEELSGLHAWWQYYSYPLGSLESGSSHSFELERSFSQQVTDGCDLDADGNPDYYGPDSSTASTLHLTVR